MKKTTKRFELTDEIKEKNKILLYTLGNIETKDVKNIIYRTGDNSDEQLVIIFKNINITIGIIKLIYENRSNLYIINVGFTDYSNFNPLGISEEIADANYRIKSWQDPALKDKMSDIFDYLVKLSSNLSISLLKEFNESKYVYK